MNINLNRVLLCTLAISLTVQFAKSCPAQEVIANWNFTDSANDTTGNGHDGVLGTGATITSQGVDFDQTNNGEVQVIFDLRLDPALVANQWTLELRGVQSDMTDGSFGAVFSSRDADGFGTIVYRAGNGNWEFWTGTGGAGGNDWNILSTGIAADTSTSYDLTARFSDSQMSFTVDDGISTQSFQLNTTNFAPQSGSRPISFGNGGNEQGEFFFDGRILGATITVTSVPEPNSALYAGLIALAMAAKRRRRITK